MSKYHCGGRVLLLGDAIHAMVPFYGQGMNAGFEDCEVLLGLLDAAGGDLGRAIAAFTAQRRADAHAICDLALDNYAEMAAHVLSRRFLAKRWLYGWLHYLAPRTFVPLYTMVSFSRLPYSAVVAKRDRQDRLLAWAGSGAVAVLLAGAAARLLGSRAK